MRNTRSIILFLLILCCFLLVANLVVYSGLLAIFSIFWSYQLLLGVALGFFSVSFVAASVLGNYFYNWFTRIYYTVSAVWMGFFTYFFLSSFVYGLAVMVSGQLVADFGMFLVFLSILAGIYGIIHAKNIKISEVKINLPNLPNQWRGRKAVWISDLHLGQLHGSGFTKKVADKVSKLSPDIVFIGGDLFDGTSAPDLSALIAPLSNINSKLGAYFISGNHEEFGNSDKFISAIKALGIKTLIDEITNIDGVQLIGVDYQNNSHKDKFKETLVKLQIDRNKPSILLKHEPKDLEIAEQEGVSLQISGHTHRAQMWPLTYVAKMIYKKYAYGLKQHGTMQVYTSSGTGSWGPPLRVATSSEIVLLTFE